MVQLDDLALGHVRGDRLRDLHQQHRADREVGGDEAVGAASASAAARGGVEVEAGGADDGVDARLQAGADVAERGVGDGEVDDDVDLAEDLGELDPERRVGPAGQLRVLGRLRPPRRPPAPMRPAAPATPTRITPLPGSR